MELQSGVDTEAENFELKGGLLERQKKCFGDGSEPGYVSPTDRGFDLNSFLLPFKGKREVVTKALGFDPDKKREKWFERQLVAFREGLLRVCWTNKTQAPGPGYIRLIDRALRAGVIASFEPKTPEQRKKIEREAEAAEERLKAEKERQEQEWERQREESRKAERQKPGGMTEIASKIVEKPNICRWLREEYGITGECLSDPIHAGPLTTKELSDTYAEIDTEARMITKKVKRVAEREGLKTLEQVDQWCAEHL